jgi:SagB-type dehydrogenase family enzyme
MTAVVTSSAGRAEQGARQVVRAYHEGTKHRWKAYAAGPEALDWETQPAPFRHFDGAPAVALPRAADAAVSNALARPFSALFEPSIPLAPSLASVGALLRLSLGITAWKSFGPDRWAVRANPSSGNLHPVEAYVIQRGVPGLAAGVYHYRPDDHALERRARFVPAGESPPFVWVALSTVVWREAWKYGERAFRYCQLDTGHAVAALHYAGAVLGWTLSEQPQVGTLTLASALGLDRPEDFPARRRPDTEREEAELILGMSWEGRPPTPIEPRDLLRMASTAEWTGVASPIDPHPMYRWPVLADVAAATRTADGGAAPSPHPSPPDAARTPAPRGGQTRSAAEVIDGRRSAQRFDPRYRLDRDDFFGLMEAVTSETLAPRGVLARHPSLDLVLMVHRVQGLDPGLYFLGRRPAGVASFASQLATHFDLTPVPGTPQGVDLRLVAAVEARALARLARGLHCHQEIAAQACLALGMVAGFDEAIERDPARYRALHREAGLLGHVFYLEAEARGLRGTGIGCFFDDELHDLLKLPDTQFQSLYHFSVGRPIDDPRIETSTTSYSTVTASEGGA